MVRRVRGLAKFVGLAIQPLIVQRERAEIGEVRRERNILRREWRIAVGYDKGDRTKRGRPYDERHDKQSAEAELAKRRQTLRCIGVDDERRALVGDEPRLKWKLPLGEILGEAFFRRVRVRHG